MSRIALTAAAIAALVLAACGSSGDATSTAPPTAATSIATGPAEHGEVREFVTGPAVTVPDGWEYPTDRVARTGAYIPANGLPTLVFVDVIW